MKLDFLEEMLKDLTEGREIKVVAKVTMEKVKKFDGGDLVVAIGPHGHWDQKEKEFDELLNLAEEMAALLINLNPDSTLASQVVKRFRGEK